MSDPGPPTTRAPSLALSIVLILLGIILLLPGVCSGVFMVIVFQSNNSFPASFIKFWAVGFTVSAGGVALIVWAVRRLRARRLHDPSGP